ncbi:MAG: hypothetical protein IH872_09295 [Chloroflexi bacterium]|nr:hypothetical protein [Chloroflexota bacterium]
MRLPKAGIPALIFSVVLIVACSGGGSTQEYEEQIEATYDLFSQSMDKFRQLDQEFADQATATNSFAVLQRHAVRMAPEMDALIADIRRVENEFFDITPPKQYREDHDLGYELAQGFRRVLLVSSQAFDAVVQRSPERRNRVIEASSVTDEFNRKLARSRLP